MTNTTTAVSGSDHYEPTGISLDIFKQRYAFTENETWDEACMRLARTVAAAEKQEKRDEWQEKFYKEIVSNRFCPGGRIWFGAGRPKSNLINCFVLDVEDSREGWGKTCSDSIIVSGVGGGIGINYSKIRPRGTLVTGTGGEAQGAVAYMRIINAIAEEIRGGGNRRSAHMMILNINHGDIEEFLDTKLEQGNLKNANVSVAFNMDFDEFIGLVEKDKDLSLSWRGNEFKKIKAKLLWNKIIDHAYKNGEPGIFNMNYANKMNNLHYCREVTATNPCAELSSSPRGSCCLGSVVLFRFVENGKINWDKLDYTIRVATRFLDNVLSITQYPLKEIEDESLQTRRIGIGVTGLHDMLLLLGQKYASEESIKTIEQLFNFITSKTYETSTYLAVEKGAFPAYDKEKFLKSGFVKTLKNSVKIRIREYGCRNSNLMSVAPTGTISMLCGNCSSGIEPIFGPAYKRKFYDKKNNDKMKEEIIFHPIFARFMAEGKDVSHFECSSDIPLKTHFEIQKTVQEYVDQSISKTILVDRDKHSKQEIEKLIKNYFGQLKGITLYPMGSRDDQPITPLSLQEAKKLWKEKNKDAVEGAQGMECKSGVCEL